MTVDATWLAFHPVSQGTTTTKTSGTNAGTSTNVDSKDGKNEGASSSSLTVTKEQAVAALVSE